jgi:hypothetical protein
MIRIPIRTSRWAIWARRLASLALPFEIIPVFMHRERLIPSDTFTLLFSIGMLLALLAILVGIIALIRLWRSGFRGWGRTLQALILGLFLAAPLGVGIAWAMTYPSTNDVATDGKLPVLVLAENADDVRLSPAATEKAFPNAVARKYPLPPERVFALVAELAGEWQWEVRVKGEPVSATRPGRLNALAMTWLGFRDEVAILVGWSGDGSNVSMRSASLFGLSDLGANGRRIEAFLKALDEAVTEAQRQGPIIEGPTPDSASEGEGNAADDN